MPLTSDEITKLYADIVAGVPKGESIHVVDDESSAEWDTIAAEVAELREKHPDGVFELPNEVPTVDIDEAAEEG